MDVVGWSIGIIGAGIGLLGLGFQRMRPERRRRGELVGHYSKVEDLHRLVISTPGDKPVHLSGVESIDDFRHLLLNGELIKATNTPDDVWESQKPFTVAPGRPVVLDWLDSYAQPTVISVGLKKDSGQVVDVAVLPIGSPRSG